PIRCTVRVRVSIIPWPWVGGEGYGISGDYRAAPIRTLRILGTVASPCQIWADGIRALSRLHSLQILMGVGLASVNENVRSTLDCGGLTPPWNNAGEKDQGGVKPPQSKVPSAHPLSF